MPKLQCGYFPLFLGIFICHIQSYKFPQDPHGLGTKWISRCNGNVTVNPTLWGQVFFLHPQVAALPKCAFKRIRMDFITEHGTLFLTLACMAGFFMAWGIGANDVANAMGTSIGSRALTFKQAILLAAIFEFAGAFLAGWEVTNTVRKGILDTGQLTGDPTYAASMVYGMLGALLSAGIWLLVASWQGWPVSTTHSIVGAIVGFGIVAFGVEAVKWAKVGKIVASWVVSPLLAGTLSFLLFKTVQKLVLEKVDPFKAARATLPFYMFLVGFVILLVTIQKGLKHILPKSALDWHSSILYAIVGGVALAVVGTLILRRIKDVTQEKGAGVKHNGVERICGVMMVFTACSMAFAHGSNDVANAVGPVAAIIGTIQHVEIGGAIGPVYQKWILLVGAVGIVFGLGTLGYRVIRTIGERITELTPSRGFSAELAAATTVVLASGLSLPVSTTHTLVGAVLGVGFAQGHKSLDFKIVGGIALSWLVTLPVGAILTIGFYYLFQAVLGGGGEAVAVVPMVP
jgi:PiT family inorganic phosphate transporter